MIKIAVVEDEREIGNQLCGFVERYKEEWNEEICVELFTDGLEILEPYSGKWDIIFMDIRLKNLDGMTTAGRIREYDADVVIIFITTMSSFAIKGYEVGALDFVLKPVNYDIFSLKLKKALNKAKQHLNVQYLLITTDSGKRKISTDEILYIEVKGHNLSIITRTENFIMRCSMNKIEKEISGSYFVRCNNSFLVNLKKITGIEKEEVIIHTYKIPISRGRKKMFLEKFAAYTMGGYQS
ncbi:MAG: LytTR family DNA-binding domain-containing protein [Bacteroidales bacterium]|nr:LytTR family DNA-binding domain-containing protein [Bacteroidales bacterium]